MGKECGEAVQFLCARGVGFIPSLLCQSLSVFARASMSVDQHAYCAASFQVPSQTMVRQSLFEHAAESPQCQDFYAVIRNSFDVVTSYHKLPRGLIYLTTAGWICVAVFAFRLFKGGSMQRLFQVLLAVFFGWMSLTAVFTWPHAPP
jgi:hypothetical protein